MTRKSISVLVALACALATAAGSARANRGERTTIVFGVQNVGDASADCPGSIFGLSFDLVSPTGAALGTGKACIQSVDEGCVPFVPGCRQILRSTWTLDLGRGSLTVPVKLRETFHTEYSLTQRGTGRIAGGTGDFADARGRLEGGGTADFSTGAVDLVYTVHLKDDAGDDD